MLSLFYVKFKYYPHFSQFMLNPKIYEYMPWGKLRSDNNNDDYIKSVIDGIDDVINELSFDLAEYRDVVTKANEAIHVLNRSKKNSSNFNYSEINKRANQFIKKRDEIIMPVYERLVSKGYTL